QIGRPLIHHRGHLRAVRHAFCLIAAGLEVDTQHIGELGLVLDHQDSLLHVAPPDKPGKLITTRSPPSGECSAAMVPPCAFTIRWQMARPRPAPPYSRLREASTRNIRSNMRDSISSGTPGALSSITTRTFGPFARNTMPT